MGRRYRKEFDKQGNTYFITTTVLGFTRIFALGDKYCEVLINSLKYLLVEHTSFLPAYVIMPSHIHFIIKMNDGESISDFMRDFKRHTSKKIKELLIADKKPDIIELLINLGRIGKYILWMDRFDDLILSSDKIIEI